VIEPPDPAVAARIRAERAKANGLAQMLRQSCRFEFNNGAKVRQRRIGDRTACATFTVTRPGGIEQSFHHSLPDYTAAYAFAMAEHIEQKIKGKDHPLMQAAID
jgi:hypothetical protein